MDELSIDFWKMLAGIAIFLIGMRGIEEALGQLSGRRFKLFLKKQTTNKLKGITGGAVVTGILQSSSLVNLMVLAFVGAGVITMPNALSVILGSNLGTTLSSWLVATLGFKTNIENLAIPVIGLAGIAYALLNRETRWHRWSLFFLGFSFLFFGLGMMKTGMSGLVNGINLARYQDAPALVFFLMGFLITSLIQSSSAMVAITLSALHAGAITLFDATAIVLGAEIGTTMKLFLASFHGIAAKRRVALGNFMFNGINVLIFLILLTPVNQLITRVSGIRDNLIALVVFQTLVNLSGIILFYPFLGMLSRFLIRRFQNSDDETLFIHGVNPADSAISLFALENETRHLIYRDIDFLLSGLGARNEWSASMGLKKSYLEKPLPERYEHIKFLHGEIHGYAIRMQHAMTGEIDLGRLDRLVAAVRNCMYSAKSMKDALPDSAQLQRSSNDTKYDFFLKTQQITLRFGRELFQIVSGREDNKAAALAGLYTDIINGYTASLRHLYTESISVQLSETEISTLLNFNREVVTAFKSLLFAAKDFLLDKNQSKYFEDLPGFIR